MTNNLRFNYLGPAAKRLIPKWAKNWQHPDQIPEFREAFKEMSADERERRLRVSRMIGWRLQLAFHTEDEYERDWLLYDARRVNASESPWMVIRTEGYDEKLPMPTKDNALDALLRFVQMHLVRRMAVCHRQGCKKTYYFRQPGQHGQRYCGQYCSDIELRAGKLRCYYKAQHRQKSRA